MAWSPDGNKIVSGSWDDTVRVWDVPPQLESVQVTQADGNPTTATNALDVASDSLIVLTFNKAVSVSDSSFTVSCDDGAGGRSRIVTGLEVTTPTSGDEMNVVYTIGAPDRGYASGAACVLSIVASSVTDAVDENQMLFSVADFEFTIYAPPEMGLESVSVTLQNGRTSSTSEVLDVRVNSDIVLRFDQAVSVSDDWFTVSCGGRVIAGLTATTTSDDTNTDNVEYRITAPSGGYRSGTTCVLSVDESRVMLRSNSALTIDVV